jgi:hypothetical protein
MGPIVRSRRHRSCGKLSIRDARVQIDGDTATVTLPSPMVLQRVEGSYAGQIERALKATYSGLKRVRLIAGVRPAAAVQSVAKAG